MLRGWKALATASGRDDSVFRLCSQDKPSFKMILLRLGPAGDPETP